VLPNVNLVKNIGFDEEATHTKMAPDELLNIPVQAAGDLIHPRNIFVNRRADLYTFKTMFINKGTILRRVKNKLLQLPFIKKMYV
jgi:hypothetical protein